MAFGTLHVFVQNYKKIYLVSNARNLKYKKYWGFHPLKFGQWTTIEELDYVLITKTKKMQGLVSRVTVVKLSDMVFEVDIATKNEEFITAHIAKSAEEAYEVATEISNYLKLEIVDNA
jgi:hypothetical protein